MGRFRRLCGRIQKEWLVRIYLESGPQCMLSHRGCFLLSLCLLPTQGNLISPVLLEVFGKLVESVVCFCVTVMLPFPTVPLRIGTVCLYVWDRRLG